MAMGRKLTTSCNERFLGSYGHGDDQGIEAGVSELGEEDVWSVVDGMTNGSEDSSTNGGWVERAAESNGSVKILGSTQRVPRDVHRAVGGLSLAFDHFGRKTASSRIVHQFHTQDSTVAAATASASPSARHVATSAPVNVPDWSNIYRVDLVESLHDSDEGMDEDEDESHWVPPHEYLAREYARSRNSAANSVFEGVGRTLKGRDMSRVRDAVWSQTGFYG